MNFVAVLPDKSERFIDFKRGPCGARTMHRAVAEKAVREAGLKGKRPGPSVALVEVFELTIKNGQLVRNNRVVQAVELPLVPMTQVEYEAAMQEALQALPPAFQSFVSHRAWEEGHSAGYEEVLMIAVDLAGSLLPCVEQYRRDCGT